MKKSTLILNFLIAVMIGFLSYSTASATAIVAYSDSFDGIGTWTYSGTASDNIGVLSFETTTWHDDPFGGYANAPDTSGYTSPASTPVPETGTFWLILTGLILLGLGHGFNLHTLNNKFPPRPHGISYMILSKLREP